MTFVLLIIFASYFEKGYSSNNATRSSELEIEYNALRRGYCGLPMPSNSLIDAELVGRPKIISDLKLGKAPGLDGLSAEHTKMRIQYCCVSSGENY